MSKLIILNDISQHKARVVKGKSRRIGIRYSYQVLYGLNFNPCQYLTKNPIDPNAQQYYWTLPVKSNQ